MPEHTIPDTYPRRIQALISLISLVGYAIQQKEEEALGTGQWIVEEFPRIMHVLGVQDEEIDLADDLLGDLLSHVQEAD